MSPVKIARVNLQGKKQHVIVEWNEMYAIKGDLYGNFEKGEHLGRLQFNLLLSPVVPGTIFGLGINHTEYKNFLPKIGRDANVGDPIVFTKPTTCAVGMSENLVIPKEHQLTGIKGSGELGVIIKDDVCKVSREEAARHILGYTNAYDALPFASYYAKEKDKHKAKGYPTFCPMGPYIVIGADVDHAMQRTYYNDTLILEGCLNGYIWDACEAISRISQRYDLKKNDVLILGACSPQKEIQDMDPYIFTRSNLVAGDVVCVETDGLGRLIMNVVDEQ